MIKPLVSVYTCVYNMSDRIQRVFKSMKSQTYSNIEHVIVDDGSTDGVEKLLEQYKKEVSFPVFIISKENGGKHTATNVAWDNCHGEYLVQLDADDELLPDAIQKLVALTENAPETERNNYWCYVARCRTQFSEKMIGKPFPENINNLAAYDAALIDKEVGGEKIALIRSSAIKDVRFPEPKGVKFVPEGVVWEILNSRFRTWYSNDIIRIYYVDEGYGLSHQKMSKQTINNKVWSCKWQLENRKKYKTKGLKCIIPYCIGYHLATKEFRKNNSYLIWTDFPVHVLLILFYVPSFLIHFLFVAFLNLT